MVIVIYKPSFRKKIDKIKDTLLKEKVKKQIAKVIASPEIGKSMRYTRKGTRELYVAPFRLSYAYGSNKDTIKFLDVYHKDEQ